MSRRRQKQQSRNAVRRNIRDLRILLHRLEFELELENLVMEVLNQKLPEFAAAFQTMPRLPIGWSTL